MGFKEEMKREMGNMMHDFQVGVSKEWHIKYASYSIVLKNELKKEELWIEGELVDEYEHTSMWSYVRPISKLTGFLPNGEKVTVTLGGIVKLTVKVKVGKEIVLKEKLKVELALPWEGKEAILPYLREQAKMNDSIALLALPDEQFSIPEDKKDVEVGYRDYLGYDMPFGSYVKKLMKQLMTQVTEQTVEARKATYTRILEEHVRMYGGELLYEIQEANIDRDRLRTEMLWFIEHGAHREVIKFALLILSYLQVDEDEELLTFMARHEEFTVFAASGLSQESLWNLVLNHLEGWGKISAMYHLEAFDQQAKDWFLKQEWDDINKRKEVALLRAEKCEVDQLLYTEALTDAQLSLIAKLIEDLLHPIEEGMEEVLLIDDVMNGGTVLLLFVQVIEKKD